MNPVEVTVIPGHRRTYPVMLGIHLAKTLGLRPHQSCLVGGQTFRTRDRACGQSATFVRAWINPTPDRPPIFPHPNRIYCQKHAVPISRRDRLPMITDSSTYVDYHQACIAREQQILEELAEQNRKAHEEQVRLNHERECQELAQNGYILRLSGHLGRVIQYRDGRIACLLNDGRQVTPCCWLEAGRIIDNRARGQAPIGHSEDCPQHTPS